MSVLYSEFKNKPSKKQEWSRQQADGVLIGLLFNPKNRADALLRNAG
jgi:hypothetical protein